jgi:hypothetical protein
MNNTILYYPYKSQAVFLVFTVPVGILSFVAAGYWVEFWKISLLFLFPAGVAGIWFTKEFYDTANIAVSFEWEGVRILGGGRNAYRYIRWEDLPYAYYATNFKGHEFLVLSPKALSRKEAKKLANRGANSSKICIDDSVVVGMNPVQNVSPIKKWVEKYVAYMNEYVID